MLDRAPQRSKSLTHDNGRRRRTEAQLARQEKIYLRSVIDSASVRTLAAEFGISTGTVTSDIRHEGLRRAAALEERRDIELARSVSIYEHAISEQMRKSAMYDAAFLAGSESGKPVRVVDNSMAIIIEARTRIDKLLGIEAPTKIDVGLQLLLDALEPKDDLPKPSVVVLDNVPILEAAE